MTKRNLEDIILDDNGKDDRLDILENGMTKYGCKSKPYPHISYSSCTASTINLESFNHIQDYYNHLNTDNYFNEFQNIRDELRKTIGLKDNVDICLSASGTDLEMLPYLFVPVNTKVCNIIVGPNEVGSGTILSAEGRVFSQPNLNKYSLKKGDKLKGFDQYDISIVNLPIRDENGKPIDDNIALNQVADIVNNNSDSYKIIHSVYHSKTGLIKPLPENLLDLVTDNKAIIVIDACQFRISIEEINQLLDKGCIVFITGSKFFGGPTFSAAALIPFNLRDIAANNKNIPEGLNFLFGKELFPNRWNSVSNFNYGDNYGLLLRWKAAIFEMQLFNSISKNRIVDTINLVNSCIKKIMKKYDNIMIYSYINDKEKDYNVLMSNTIITFGFKNKNINFDKTKKIYQILIGKSWLNNNYKYSVHLGQPVKIRKYNDEWLGTLRIALSSKFFINYSGKIQSVQKEIISKELDYIFCAVKLIEKEIN